MQQRILRIESNKPLDISGQPNPIDPVQYADRWGESLVSRGSIFGTPSERSPAKPTIIPLNPRNVSFGDLRTFIKARVSHVFEPGQSVDAISKNMW